MAEHFDDAFMAVASQQGDIKSLLRTFFSFMHRKTDFYVINREKHGRMGFPPGGAEKLVLDAFHSFPFKAPAASVGPAESTASKKASRKKAKEAACSATIAQAKAEKDGPVGALATPVAAAPLVRTGEGKRQESVVSDSGPRIRYNDKGEQIPIGNGGVTDKYWWQQTLRDATVYIDVPQGTKGKEISVDFRPRHLKVTVKGDVVLDGELGGDLKASECMWSLDSNRTIILSLDKRTETWWRCVLEGDPKIDATQVDSTQQVHEYDPETQGAIRKIMFDQRQKRLGLPTSDEIQTESILDKARHLPGSPFLAETHVGLTAPPDGGTESAEAVEGSKDTDAEQFPPELLSKPSGKPCGKPSGKPSGTSTGSQG